MSGTKWKLTVGHMIGFLILAALVLPLAQGGGRPKGNRIACKTPVRR